MSFDPATFGLVAITFFAAFVNGAFGYGFSSLTVPIGLLFLSNRVLNPVLVAIEVLVNLHALFINRASLPAVWPRAAPILIGLLPGIAVGGYLLASAPPGWVKLGTYALLLPLVLLQAAGARWPIRREQAIGVPFGAGLGFLYSVSTISGPPLALLFNNQGLVKQDFRAALALIRLAESTLTAFIYWHVGLFVAETWSLVATVATGVLIGIPLGAFAIRTLDSEIFRRICMSFDVWIVGFGLSHALLERKLAHGPIAYSVLLAAVLLDLWLLYAFCRGRGKRAPSPRAAQ